MGKPLRAILFACANLTLLFGALQVANPDHRSADHPLGDFHRWPWTKLNDQPALLDSYVMELCRPPTKVESHQWEVDPHRKNYINVYVNGRGRSEMLSGANLPVGTVIVKEQLASPEGPAV